MSANDKQIGGSHYKNGSLEHWDVVERYGVGYLEGCATKYISRWRNKNGVQDLEKARHYIQKLKELHKESVRYQRGRVPMTVVDAFITAQKLQPNEAEACRLLFRWQNFDDLQLADLHVRQLIEVGH